MIEIDAESGRGYFYGELHEQALNFIGNKIESVETICGIKITTFSVQNFQSSCNTHFNLFSLGDLKCKHGNPIEYTTINRLPQEGWCEMIDCWSCHDHEFKSLLDLKVKPRPRGLLTSNFYLIAHPDYMPDCCKGQSKIYYNQLNMHYTEDCIIYKFFEEYFASRNSIILTSNNKNKTYEIRFFYSCIIYNEKANHAIKVGIKETDKQCGDLAYIGEYFVERIIEKVITRMLPIKLLGYNISFVVSD